MFHGYKLVGIIGEGTYGQVFKATKGRELDHFPWYEANGPPFYAVKRPVPKKDGDVAKKCDTETAFSVNLLREVKLLRELKHPNIVNMCDLILDPRTAETSLVFEYAEYEMMKIIDHYKGLKNEIPEYTVKSFLWQSLKAVQYLHENWVMHRDLKPENILIIGGDGPRRGCVVLADLGLARIFRNPIFPLGHVDKVVVTLWYRAPELLLGASSYTPAIDMWSMGCIFAALLLAKDPNVKALFQGRQAEKEEVGVGGVEIKGPLFEADQCDKIFRVLGLPDSSSWPDFDKLQWYSKIQKDKNYPTSPVLKTLFRNSISDNALNLLTKLLELNPNKRLTATEALRHPYFMTEPKPGENAFERNSSMKQMKFPIEPPKPIDLAQKQAQDQDIAEMQERIKSRHEEGAKRQRIVYGET